MEEWKSISQREDYEVSNFGNCRRKMKKGGYKTKPTFPNQQGYKIVQFQNNKIITNKTLHSLVAEAFIGERPKGLVIDHIDRDKTNNNVSNLRYVSQKENRINSNNYRSEITETDPKERERIRSRENYILNREKRLQQRKQRYLLTKT